MKTRFCPNCNKEIPEDARWCERCRIENQNNSAIAPSGHSRERSTRARNWIVAVFCIVAVTIAGIIVVGDSLPSALTESMVLALLLLILVLFLSGLIAIAVVLISSGSMAEKAAECCVIIAIIGIVVAIALPWFVMRREPNYYGSACFKNLKQLALVMNLYIAENEYRFPPIDRRKNIFLFDTKLIYPDYLVDAFILECSSSPDYDPERSFRLRSIRDHPGSSIGDVHPDCIIDRDYVYLGWEVTSDEEAEAFFKAYDGLSPEDYGEDIVDPADGSILFPSLRGCMLLHIPDPEEERVIEQRLKNLRTSDKPIAEIPVIWDRPHTELAKFSHIPAGGNVLYQDGHLEFVRYGEKFPMTETMARLLEERPRALIPDCMEGE